jgi:hypothetical protein
MKMDLTEIGSYGVWLGVCPVHDMNQRMLVCAG